MLSLHTLPSTHHTPIHATNDSTLEKTRTMDLTTTLTGFVALYIFMLAAFTGYEIIGRVPAILHTPLMSGSNFVHGIVVVGAMYALLNATSTIEQIIGFVGVLLGAGNAAGGYVVTERMLEMFKPSSRAPKNIEGAK